MCVCVCTIVRDLYIALLFGGSWAAAHSPLFGRFLVLKMQNFLRGALPRTPLGLPAPDPRLGLRPRPRVRRCRRPEAELRLQAKVARCRLSSKKIAIYDLPAGCRSNNSSPAPPACTPAPHLLLALGLALASRSASLHFGPDPREKSDTRSTVAAWRGGTRHARRLGS